MGFELTPAQLTALKAALKANGKTTIDELEVEDINPLADTLNFEKDVLDAASNMRLNLKSLRNRMAFRNAEDPRLAAVTGAFYALAQGWPDQLPQGENE